MESYYPTAPYHDHMDETETTLYVPNQREPSVLDSAYLRILASERFGDDGGTRYVRRHILGEGGQATVLLCERTGVDGFDHPFALKVFSPKIYRNSEEYFVDMRRMGHVALKIADIQHDNLVNVRLWTAYQNIRMLEMEWIDGYDLAHLTRRETFERLLRNPNRPECEYLTQVVVQQGLQQSRLTPGVAVAIIRDCLAGLSALHHANIVHNDVKPSNIMVKKTGRVKLIDIGSAISLNEPHLTRPLCTLPYAAPELLEKGLYVPQSDVASLGYVLVELLTGKPPFPTNLTQEEQIRAKKRFADNLENILPQPVLASRLLLTFIRRMVAADPMDRFPDAESANLEAQNGAAAFLRELVRSNLATEYDQELRRWLQAIRGTD